MTSGQLSARTIAGIVVELEICGARLVRLYGALRSTEDHTKQQRIIQRIGEVNKLKRSLILELDYYSVDRQIGEAFNPGQPFSTEAQELLGEV
jgi:hypothetical protein